MYEKFFNLQTMPFENVADARFFYASEQHREALAAIEYTIRMRKGIVLLTGDIGSGKTTIGQTVQQRCSRRATIIQLLHGHESGLELIRHVARSLNLDTPRDDDHATVLEQVRLHLHQQAHDNKPVVLFVDEAQTLSDSALEELRLLTNFDHLGKRLLQLVLVGQPELRNRIRQPALAPLRQRIVMAKQLRPFDLQCTGQYIRHRLKLASADPQNVRAQFSEDAINAIYDFTLGTPRLINVVCDNCLLLAYVKKSNLINIQMINRVIEDMVPVFEPLDDPQIQTSTFSLAGNF